ncbi:MAG: terpene cyclase/mutase family protein [Deltaproteobacteria bacterium]|nr:terpene cyclase/mutase family protein [Deltaproteobacteria bacterium]MBW2697948.1 terpene cyclase/mutase family protein [Deltaproteobacteria bacterium]
MSDRVPASAPVQISRRRFMQGAASAAGALCLPACIGPDAHREPQWSRDAKAALATSHAWLWSAQSVDGRFPSRTYGLLATGQSLTPFALDSLLQSEPKLFAPEKDSVARGIGALLRMRDATGALGLSGPSADYPCYATGLMLSCLGASKPRDSHGLAAPSIAWLRGQQFLAAKGWTEHPAQGGWGMGARTPRTPPNAGHVDLSMTRRVVEGLRAVGVPAHDPALLEARAFVLRCQTSDGSFLYSPVEQALNKGLRDPGGEPRGYGSATADGLLCLDALELTEGDAFVRGLAWLFEHHRTARNPGLEGGPMEPFAEAMRGYYRAGAARCFQRWGGPAAWRPALADAIVQEQEADGHFRNPNGLQKEDDPIIATGFAVQALAALRSRSNREPAAVVRGRAPAPLQASRGARRLPRSA